MGGGGCVKAYDAGGGGDDDDDEDEDEDGDDDEVHLLLLLMEPGQALFTPPMDSAAAIQTALPD